MQYDLILDLVSCPSLVQHHTPLIMAALSPLMTRVPSDPGDLLNVLTTMLSHSAELSDSLHQWLLSNLSNPDVLLQVKLVNQSLIKANTSQ